MKPKYYLKTLFPVCLFGMVFRVLEIMFAIEPSTGFYYGESIIPFVFGIYIFLVSVFFLSEIFFTKTESRSQKKRLTNICIADKIIIILLSVCILASSIKSLLLIMRVESGYFSVKDIFFDFPVYILFFAFLSCIFLIVFITDPSRCVSNKFFTLISVSLPIYYALRIFVGILDLDQILSRPYITYSFYFMGFLILSLMNLSKILSGTLCKRLFVAFSLCAFFFSTIHIIEFIMSLLSGNPYGIVLSDDYFTYIGDFLCSLMVLRFTCLLNVKLPSKKESASDDSSLPEEMSGKIIPSDPTVPSQNTETSESQENVDSMPEASSVQLDQEKANNSDPAVESVSVEKTDGD